MKAWDYVPGVPAAGHVTSGGFWHPGRATGCTKCGLIGPPDRLREAHERGEHADRKAVGCRPCRAER